MTIDQLNELKTFLELPIGQNFSKYRQKYQEIFGQTASGCKCMGLRIYNEINDYYIKEKQKYDELQSSKIPN
jgi:hypothetical protein